MAEARRRISMKGLLDDPDAVALKDVTEWTCIAVPKKEGIKKTKGVQQYLSNVTTPAAAAASRAGGDVVVGSPEEFWDAKCFEKAAERPVNCGGRGCFTVFYSELCTKDLHLAPERCALRNGLNFQVGEGIVGGSLWYRTLPSDLGAWRQDEDGMEWCPFDLCRPLPGLGPAPTSATAAPQPPVLVHALRPAQLACLKWLREGEAAPLVLRTSARRCFVYRHHWKTHRGLMDVSEDVKQRYEVWDASQVATPPLTLRSDLMLDVCACFELALRGGVVGAEMGFGKTAVALGLVCADLEAARAVPLKLGDGGLMASRATLVVVTRNLMGQWLSEMEKFFGASTKSKGCPVRVLCLWSAANLARASPRDLATADVVLLGRQLLTSPVYAAARRDPASLRSSLVDAARGPSAEKQGCLPLLERFRWRRILVDEVHEVFASTRRELAHLETLTADRVWGFTGTPPRDDL